ncbi:MAG: DUF4149 domain-containing protein [Actinomycetia bacterium]|nr:DUF4149 domain-containing protein [Actinomycetes bacterium]
MARTIHALALGAWLALLGFFTVAVPAAVFAAVPAAAVLAVLDRLFPAFYQASAFAGAVAWLAAGGLRRRAAASRVVLGAAFALTLLGWLVLLPHAHAAVGTSAFGRWHGLSLGADLLTTLLVVAAGVLALLD